MHKLHHSVFKHMAVAACSLFLLLGIAQPAFADTLYTNAETGYEVVVEDDASLLTEDDISTLESSMEPLTAYGNVVFKSISENSSSASSYARNYYNSLFGSESGTLLLIDMDNRYIYIHNTGYISYHVTSSQCDIITDNIYRDASNSDYLSCGTNAYQQLFQVLEGERIAQPMKYICNLLLALILALLANYALVRAFSSTRKPSTNQLLNGVFTKCELHNARAEFINETKVYSPVAKSSPSGGGGGHSGGGHSGGGHSSGGGSHHSGGGHRF